MGKQPYGRGHFTHLTLGTLEKVFGFRLESESRLSLQPGSGGSCVSGFEATNEMLLNKN
jgi:hypothetical protein